MTVKQLLEILEELPESYKEKEFRVQTRDKEYSNLDVYTTTDAFVVLGVS